MNIPNVRKTSIVQIKNMASAFTATYKVLLLGDSNVGKTSIVQRFCEKQYSTFKSTIGVDCKQKIVNLDGVPIKLQIWDTAGQERFGSITASYYRNAMGVLLMYDVTNFTSFKHLTDWLRDIQEYTSSYVSVLLVGNKCESSNRVVDTESGKKMANNFDFPFIEVSCENNINVEEAFLTLACQIHDTMRREGHPFEQVSTAAITFPTPAPSIDKSRCSSC